MAQKLTKPWGPHPAGTPITTDREEAQNGGAIRVNAARLKLLAEGGFLAAASVTAPAPGDATPPPLPAPATPPTIVPPHVFSAPPTAAILDLAGTPADEELDHAS